MDNYILAVFTAYLYGCLVQQSEAVALKKSAFHFTPPVHIAVVETQTLRLKCTPSNMINNIQWNKLSSDGQEAHDLRPSDRVKYEIFGYVLVISDLRWEDTGRYRCSVIKGTNVLEFFVINVQVHTVPFWRQAPKDLLLYPGDAGEIQCDAGGSPSPTISWEIDTIPIIWDLNRTNSVQERFSKFYLDGDKLVITNAQPEDTSVVRCIAANDYGKLTADVFLDVLEMAPRFVHIPDSISQVVTGNDITVKCTAIGSPTPSITWTLNSQPITLNTTSTEARFNLDKDGSLIIYRSKQSYNEGMYTCKAENALGQISSMGELQVKARTQVQCQVEEMIAKKGKHVFLRCTVQADPALQVTVTWEKNGKPLNAKCSEEDRIFQPPDLGGNDSVLVIRSLTREDSGVYGCVARTPLDKSADQTELIVQDVPDPPGPVEVTYRSDASVIVSWQQGVENSSPTELFIVYMNSTWDRGVWKILKMLPPRSRSTVVNLEHWTSYNFRVKQLNGVGYSELSDTSATYLTHPSRPYSNPENVRAWSNDNQYINVTWKPMPFRQHNGPGFHYGIHWRRPDVEDMWYTEEIEDPAASSFILPTNGKYGEYEIRVRAANDIGMAPTPWSVEVFMIESNLNTLVSSRGHGNIDTGINVSEPSQAPRNIEATTESPFNIQLTWTAINANETGGALQGYKVRYWRRGANNDVQQITTSSAATTADLTDLRAASVYTIQMFGFNEAGKGPVNSMIVETPQATPGPVTEFHVEPTLTSLQIEWNEPDPDTVFGMLMGYHVKITKFVGMMTEEIRDFFIDDPTATGYVASDLTPDTIYRAEVRARTSTEAEFDEAGFDEAGFGIVTYWEGKTLAAK